MFITKIMTIIFANSTTALKHISQQIKDLWQVQPFKDAIHFVAEMPINVPALLTFMQHADVVKNF